MIDAGGPLVEADRLACVRGGRPVFADVSFAVGAGDVLALTGPNGAGKSSLLRVVAGLIRPAGGTLEVRPTAEERPSVHLLAYADALKPALTLRANFGFWQQVYGGEADGDIDAAAEAVGLDHALDLPAGVLSSGQRRRAGLARLALSPRPIWLLDEPLAALDREGEGLLGERLRAHRDGGGIAIVATHQPLPVAATATLALGP